MSVCTILFLGVLLTSSVLGTAPYSAPAPTPCACATAYDTKPYAPAHAYGSSRKTENESIMRTARYGAYGAPSYGGPTYGAGYGAEASAAHYGGAAPAYKSHAISYEPAYPKKHHSGLVITCQPNLAGYAHGTDATYGGHGSGAYEGHGSGAYGGHEAAAYRSAGGYSRPYAHMSYESVYDAPGPIYTYKSPSYSAPAKHHGYSAGHSKSYNSGSLYSSSSYSAPAYKPTYSATAYSPPSYSASAYSAPPATVYEESSYSAPTYSAHSYAPAAPSYSAPSYSAPAPGYSASAPSYSVPAPSYRPVAPSYSAPAPSYSAPVPSYSGPASGYSAPAPSYSAPAPSYSAPAPSYSAPAPSYGAPAPSYGAPAPSYGGSAAPVSYEVVPAYRAADEEVKDTLKTINDEKINMNIPSIDNNVEVANKLKSASKHVANQVSAPVEDTSKWDNKTPLNQLNGLKL